MFDIDYSCVVFAKSQISDYACRGEDLADFDFSDFLVDTYEIERDEPVHASMMDGDGHCGSGRPQNARFKYLPLHPKAKSVQRVPRSHGH